MTHGETDARLWRLHDLLVGELQERRGRAGTIFAVAATLSGGLTAVGLTGSIPNPIASAWIAPAYFGLLIYSGLVTVLAFFGLNPGLPWERGFSAEGMGLLMARILGVGVALPAERAERYRKEYACGPLSYRHYANHATRERSSTVTIASAVSISGEALADRIQALSLQIRLARRWRRVVVLALAVDLVLVATYVLVVLAVGAPGTVLSIAFGGGMALILVALIRLAAAFGLKD